MSAPLANPRGLIEQAALDPKAGGTVPTVFESEIELSKAISLKRIADALWGTDDTSGLLQLLNPLDVRNNY